MIIDVGAKGGTMLLAVKDACELHPIAFDYAMSEQIEKIYDVIEACSRGPFLEMFARDTRKGWRGWGDQADNYEITWETYARHSRLAATAAE